jgi:hypothetical protein
VFGETVFDSCREEVRKLKAINEQLFDQLNTPSKAVNPVVQLLQRDEVESSVAFNSTSSTPNYWLEIFMPSSAISQVYTPGQYLRCSESAPAAKPCKQAVQPCESHYEEKSQEEETIYEHGCRLNDKKKDEIKVLKQAWSSCAKGLPKGQAADLKNAEEPCMMCSKVEMLYPVLARELRALSPQSCKRQPATLEELFPVAVNQAAAAPDTKEETHGIKSKPIEKILDADSIQLVENLQVGSVYHGAVAVQGEESRMQDNTGGDVRNDMTGFIAGERMRNARAGPGIEILRGICEAGSTALAESQKRLAEVEAIKEELEKTVADMTVLLATEKDISSLVRVELEELKQRVAGHDVATQAEAPDPEGSVNVLQVELDLIREAAAVVQERLVQAEGTMAMIEAENVALKAQLTTASSAGCVACGQIGYGVEDSAAHYAAAEVVRLKEALTGERERAIQAVMAVREKLADAVAKNAELEASMESMRAQLAREQHTVSSLRVELALQAIPKAGKVGGSAGDSGAFENGTGGEVVEVGVGAGSESSKCAATCEGSFLSQDTRAQVDMCKKRLSVGFEKVNALLAGEQEVSSSLRAVLFSLQAQRKQSERRSSSESGVP